MSDGSRLALQNGESYLQSPVDDIESFSWVLLYGIVQNSAQGPRSSRDDLLQRTLDKSRDAALNQFNRFGADPTMDYCLLTHTLSASRLLRKYEDATYNLRNRWVQDCHVLRTTGVQDSQVWELCYHAAAVSGLSAVIQILIDFKNSTSQK